MDLHVQNIMHSAIVSYSYKAAKASGNASTAVACCYLFRAFCALPAWGGFISAELINRINAFLSACSFPK